MQHYLTPILEKFGIIEAKYEILVHNYTNSTFLIFHDEYFYILKVAVGENAITRLEKENAILSELSLLQNNIPIYLYSKNNKRVEILNFKKQVLGSSLYLMKKGVPIELPDAKTIDILMPNLITLNKNLGIIEKKVSLRKITLIDVLSKSYKRYKMCNISILDDVYSEMLEYIKLYKSRFQLIHGDLHYGNILVDEDEGKINIIDFGDCHVGDVLFEISSLLLPPFNNQKIIKQILLEFLKSDIINKKDIINLNLIMAIKYYSLILNGNEINIVQAKSIHRIIKEYLINYKAKKEVYLKCL